jgi:hypothetical protein
MLRSMRSPPPRIDQRRKQSRDEALTTYLELDKF